MIVLEFYQPLPGGKRSPRHGWVALVGDQLVYSDPRKEGTVLAVRHMAEYVGEPENMTDRELVPWLNGWTNGYASISYSTDPELLAEVRTTLAERHIAIPNQTDSDVLAAMAKMDAAMTRRNKTMERYPASRQPRSFKEVP